MARCSPVTSSLAAKVGASWHRAIGAVNPLFSRAESTESFSAQGAAVCNPESVRGSKARRRGAGASAAPALVASKESGGSSAHPLRELRRGPDRPVLRQVRPAGDRLSALLRFAPGRRLLQLRRPLFPVFFMAPAQALAPDERVHRRQTRPARTSPPRLPHRERDFLSRDQLSLPRQPFSGRLGRNIFQPNDPVGDS
ncbi:hypothetical protein BH20VER3_BH20VER3_22200 [soil metagenome]